MHFVYVWRDDSRKMYYIGSHSGDVTDGYVSSSRWLNSEYRFRPTDFRRRIVRYFNAREDAQCYEMFLLSLISYGLFGVKYYNLKTGKPKGTIAWNKGKRGVYSESRLKSQSNKMKGNKSNTGKPQPHASNNGKVGAKKLSATGRKKVVRNGKRTWAYVGDADYPG